MSGDDQIEKGNAYAALVEKQIEALFAASRDAEGDEIGAYAQLRMPGSSGLFRGVYVAFAGQGVKWEGQPTDYVENVDDEAQFIIDAVKQRFPDHASQRLIWRRRPKFEIVPEQKASRKYGIEARPAAQQIYCRLVGVPLDAEFIGKWRDAV